MSTWIERKAREKAIRQIALFLLVTAFVGWIYFLNADYWVPFFKGPTGVYASGLDAAEKALKDPYNKGLATPFATVTGDEVMTTGVQEVTTYEGVISRVSAGYYALRIGDRLLIVKSSKQPSTTVTGALTAMPVALETQLLPEGTDAETKAAVYPLLLETKYRESGFIAIFWGLVVETIFGFFAWFGWHQLSGRHDHAAVKRARTWGELAAVSQTVENELSSAVKHKGKGWTVTENYAVKNQLFIFDLFRFDGLVWAYKQTTKRSVNFIPVGKSYSVVAVFSDGRAEIAAGKLKADELLQTICTRAPWAVVGFSPDLEARYTKSKADFVAEIMARKKQVVG